MIDIRSDARAALTLVGVLFTACIGTASAAQPTPAGEAAYAKYCAACHEQVSPRIPTRDALTKMSPARILRTLDFGQMMSVAYAMRRDEREAVAQFLGKGKDESALPASAFCKADQPVMAVSLPHSWSGWAPSLSNTRFQAPGPAGLNAGDLGRLQLKWAFGFSGDVTAFAAPTVQDGSLFVGSAGGMVQALDAKSGCVHWQYQADGPVRAAMTIAADGAQRTLVFSDQNGGVYAVDARSGKERWKMKVEAHEATRLTGSFAVQDGMAFVPAASWEETRSIDPTYPCCTFRGSITAVRVRDGSVLWKTYLVDRPRKTGTMPGGAETFGPSGAGVWSAPTVDTVRGLLYVATGDNYSYPATATSDAIVALSLKDGHIVWSQQTTPGDVFNSSCARVAKCPFKNGPDVDFGSSAMLVQAPNGRDILLAGQKSGVVYAFDPDNKGKVLWQTRVGKGGANGGIQWGMASDGRNVYAPVAGSVRQRGDWSGEGAGGLAPIGNAQFDPQQGGGLTALNVLDGTKIWFAANTPCAPPRAGCSPAQSAALTAIEGAVFSGAMDGHLRAFSTVDGKLLWDVDTAKSYTTVNGVPGNGGSLDGAGPVIVDGMLFVNSGYPRFGGMPGNVLLAFALPEVVALPQQAAPPSAAVVNVVLHTTLGDIHIALETERAPITAKNFLRYIDSKRFDGMSFYRAVKIGDEGKYGLVQAGLKGNPKSIFKPIAHEAPGATGLSHVDGAISMAHSAPGTATADFFIVAGDLTALDGKGTQEDPGYAVFGHVTQGMDVVRAINDQPRNPDAGDAAMKGQMLANPIKVLSVRRVD